MILSDAFWRGFELDLAEIKISYLNWAIGYAREPAEEYRHLFLWPEQTEFCAVNSRYGRAFAISPFGPGVRGVPRPKERRPMPRGIDEIDVALMKRLNSNTRANPGVNQNRLTKGRFHTGPSNPAELLLAQTGAARATV